MRQSSCRPPTVLLIAALLLPGCQGAARLDGFCLDTCGDYTGAFESVIGFPAAAATIGGPDGLLWGSMFVGDTLRLALVSYGQRTRPCAARDTLRDRLWGITAVGRDGRWGDTASARLVRNDRGTEVIVAVQPGAFGVATSSPPPYAALPADLPAQYLYICAGSDRPPVEMVRVLARQTPG